MSVTKNSPFQDFTQGPSNSTHVFNSWTMSLKREIIFYDVSHHSTKHLLAHPASSAQVSKGHYLAELSGK